MEVIQERKKMILLGTAFLAVFLALSAILFQTQMSDKITVPEKNDSLPQCTSNSDCVPSSCCHANSCVLKGSPQEPQCSGVLCTQVCAQGSLDCGAGICACVNNECKAVLK